MWKKMVSILFLKLDTKVQKEGGLGYYLLICAKIYAQNKQNFTTKRGSRGLQLK